MRTDYAACQSDMAPLDLNEVHRISLDETARIGVGHFPCQPAFSGWVADTFTAWLRVCDRCTTGESERIAMARRRAGNPMTLS